MSSGDQKYAAYPASSNLTVTNLNSLAASATYIAGWESALIDNTSNLYTDYALTAKLTVAASNNQAGELRMYVAAMLDDSTWHDVFDGTESTETLTSVEIRDAICFQAASTLVTNTASRAYCLHCGSVAALFGGNLPAKFVVYITGNATTTTTAQLAASGNQVTVKGSYLNIAA